LHLQKAGCIAGHNFPLPFLTVFLYYIDNFTPNFFTISRNKQILRYRQTSIKSRDLFTHVLLQKIS